ncbi:MAG: M20 family metallopeptidase [Fusobacteriaceae bacterium]|nr:M20 family metallopeptidase [Fusobacteriaceae bacterium]
MNKIQDIAFNYINSKKQEMITLWEQLVNMESGTMNKENVDKVALFLKNFAESMGAKAKITEFSQAGNALVVEIGEPTNKPHVCFVGHYDTVFPYGTVAKRPFKIENGKAYGPGVLDMKAGIVIQLYVAKALMEAGYNLRQIKIILAGDEESGHHNSEMPKVFEKQCQGAIAAINFETGDVSNALVIGRKGTAAYNFFVKGIAVHAGRDPEKGASAILEIAHKIIDIQELNDYKSGITYNVGKIKGGVTRNAVPDEAEIEIDIRVMDETQFDEVENKISKIAAKTYVKGTTTKYIRTIGIAPMKLIKENERLFELVSRVSEKLGFAKPHSIISGGGSDSAYSTKVGVPTIDQMGVKGEWNHSDREYAVVDTLFERAKLAIACVLELENF